MQWLGPGPTAIPAGVLRPGGPAVGVPPVVGSETTSPLPTVMYSVVPDTAIPWPRFGRMVRVVGMPPVVGTETTGPALWATKRVLPDTARAEGLIRETK